MKIIFKRKKTLQDSTQHYNNLLHFITKDLGFVQHKKSHYDPETKINIPEYK